MLLLRSWGKVSQCHSKLSSPSLPFCSIVGGYVQKISLQGLAFLCYMHPRTYTTYTNVYPFHSLKLSSDQQQRARSGTQPKQRKLCWWRLKIYSAAYEVQHHLSISFALYNCTSFTNGSPISITIVYLFKGNGGGTPCQGPQLSMHER